MERQDGNTTGLGVRTGRRARPVDEHDVRRRTQSLARRTGCGRSSLFLSRIRQGWQQIHSEVSQMPQGLEKTVPVVFTETSDMACVVRHGRGDDQAWAPLAVDYGVVIGRVLLTALGGSEPHRSKPSSSGTQRSPTLGCAPIPARGKTTRKVGAADDTVAIDSGRVNWMRRVFPVLADHRSSLPLFKTDFQSFLEIFRRASNFFGLEAVLYQMRHPGPSLDLAKGVRDITSCQKRRRWATMTSLKRYEKHARLNDTWRLLSPATQAYCLTCEHDAEGFFGGKNMPFATEAGRISSKRQPQIASSSRLFEYRARHWKVFGSTKDRWSFVRDRLRQHDISGQFVQVPRGEDFTSSLSALSKLASELRVPSAFLFRGYAGANTDSRIDPRKQDEQTIVNLHLCCFGSRTFSPCTLVFQGCSRE